MTGGGRVVRAADLVPRPWPNGLGITRDVARADRPDGRFAWLLSIADLERDAPFSHFPDCDRVFTLVAGDPIVLSVGGAEIRSGLLVPTLFPGDRPTTSRITGAPGRAFNVFVDRRSRRAAVSAANLAAGHAVSVRGEEAAVHCVAGDVAAGEGSVIGPGDTWVGAGGATLRATDRPSVVILVAIDEAG